MAKHVVDFHSLGLWVNLAIFVVCAAVVWSAGTRLAGVADRIAVRTGVSQALLGAVLLGVSTSLPELATTVVGARLGNAELVTGNLFGGVALQVSVLAIVDAVAVKGPLTYFTPQPVLLFQGVMLLLLLAVAIGGAAVGEPLTVGHVGVTPLLLVAGYVVTVHVSLSSASQPRWRATDEALPEAETSSPHRDQDAPQSRATLIVWGGASALAILLGGWGLARAGDALAEQTGLGASFVGSVLVASSTSLPELSTSLEAVRRGRHAMAVSNILGTNCLEMALFLVADVAYTDGAILGTTTRSALFTAATGMVVTALFLLGLLERRNRTVLGMGLDSLGVLAVYLGSLVGLYSLR